jgi:hypothetical protein
MSSISAGAAATALAPFAFALAFACPLEPAATGAGAPATEARSIMSLLGAMAGAMDSAWGAIIGAGELAPFMLAPPQPAKNDAKPTNPKQERAIM